MIRARIKAIRDAHSERSQIQAIDDDELEYRVEVPTAVLAGVSRSRELVLVMSWVIEEIPVAASSSVDADFAALMASRQRDLTGLLPGTAATPRDPLSDLFTGTATTPQPTTPRPSDSAAPGGPSSGADRPPPTGVPAVEDSSQATSDLGSQLLTSSVKNQSSINLERQLATMLGLTQ